MPWNPRFVAYAQSRKCTPEEVLKLDKKRWPGASMTGFTLWIDEQWAVWLKAHPLPAAVKDDAKFDRWLAEKWLASGRRARNRRQA